MKPLVGVVVVAMVLAALAGGALAGMAPGMMGMGPGMMGMGPGMMGGGGCPGMVATGTGTPVTPITPITEEKAKALAQEYADTYIEGSTVEKVLPWTGRHGMMYSVELKGPGDEVRVLHINPFGTVMPFGGPWRRGT
jgi:hypothetical protein